MKLTIIPSDQFVAVDGYGIGGIDMAGMPEDVHAVQFDGGLGEVEIVGGDNQPITSIEVFQPIIDRYHAAKHEIEQRAINPFYGMTAEQAVAKALETKLAQIDAIVQGAQSGNFTYQGKTFYSDPDFIHKTLTRIERLPDEHQLIWKTADKQPDGLNNIYVQMTKVEFQAFADFMYDYMAAFWFIGDAKKTQVKALFSQGATAEQVRAYDHTTGWED